jgi:2'-5' RNA ligase
MDIKHRLRTLLNEGKHKKTDHKNEFGCVMIFLDADKEKWDKMLALIPNEDLYQPADDPSFGKENDPHVTVLFGLHNDIPEEDIEAEIEKIKTPDIKFGGVSSFKNKEFEVIKFDVESKDMMTLNKKFAKFPHTKTFDYHPHCTIAYVKVGLGDKYVKKLAKSTDIEMTPSHVVYSKADGSKNEYPLS